MIVDSLLKNNSKNAPRPKTLPVKVASIPGQIKELKRWVCWRYEWRQDERGNGKWTKVPYNPQTLFKAKSNDPLTWGTFDLATYKWKHFRNQADRPIDGIGFMLGDDW